VAENNATKAVQLHDDMKGYGSETDDIFTFTEKPLVIKMVTCCNEKLCGRINIAPHGTHPLYTLSTASKRKIYQSEKRKVIG